MGKQKQAPGAQGVYKGECQGKYFSRDRKREPLTSSPLTRALSSESPREVCRSHRCFWHGHQKALSSGASAILIGIASVSKSQPIFQLAIETAGLVTLHLQPARRSSIPTINRAPNSQLAKHPGTVISPTKHLTRQDRKDRKVASSN
jgi:hypothetical protein